MSRKSDLKMVGNAWAAGKMLPWVTIEAAYNLGRARGIGEGMKLAGCVGGSREVSEWGRLDRLIRSLRAKVRKMAGELKLSTNIWTRSANLGTSRR